MTATITLDSPRDSITFTATGGGSDIFGAAPSAGAFIYDDESLDSWYALPQPDVRLAKRPSGHGAYGLGKTTTGEATPQIIGKYLGLSHSDAVDARERLSAMYNDGAPIVMRVSDVKGITSRVVWVTEFTPDWTAVDHFDLTMSFVAPDPRRYGPNVDSGSTGLPTASTGLWWPLGTSTRDQSATTPLYFDWGTQGRTGTLTAVNTGNATAFPLVKVGGGGSLPGGFRVTERETGREMTFPQDLPSDSSVTVNSRTRRATMNDGDVTEVFSSREWFSVPPGETRTYGLTALGIPDGDPQMSVSMMPANL